MRDVGAIYLYRYAEGDLPVRRFLQSYQKHPAGIEHDLHVIFKGFPDRRSVELGLELFANIPINSIELEDVGYDIGSYVQAAKAVSNQRLIFLNTFSEILGRNWLRHFDRALSLPQIGLVGATGSWQALTSGYEAGLKVLLHRMMRLPGQLRGRLDRSASGAERANALNIRRRPLRRYILSPFEYLYYYFEFGRYPNPHIRTNAFMVERQRFLTLNFPSFAKKGDAYKFESGLRSLTNQIMSRDLKPVVVDRNGNVYNIDQWKLSSTFWINDQVNLIVADNRTRDYKKGNADLREFFEDSAWSDPWSWRINRAPVSIRR